MNCPKCNAENSKEALCCIACGEPLNQGTPLKKRKYFAKTTDKTTRRTVIVAYLLALACVLSLVGGIFSIFHSPIADIPVISTALDLVAEDPAVSASLQDLDQLQEELGEEIEKARDFLEENDDDLTAEEKDLILDLLDIGEDLTKDFTLNNLSAVFDVVAEMTSSSLYSEMEEVWEAEEQLDEAMEIFDLAQKASLLITIFTVALALPLGIALLFSLFGGIFHVRGFVIAGLILSFLWSLLLCPFFVSLLITASHVALIVVHSLLYHRYKVYRTHFMETAA